MSSQNRIGLILVGVVVVSIAVLVFNRDAGASAGSDVANISVACGPSQQAVVRKTGTGASAQVNVLCIDAAAMPDVTDAAGDARLEAPAGHWPAAVAAGPAAVAAPTPVAQVLPAAPTPRVLPAAPGRRVGDAPSLQKRLLIIGGTSGAGAGIGALVGGKKGALIGAAIGGGGAAIVDQVKHR